MSKKDNSPKVYQREKLKLELNIREFEWTDKQKQIIAAALDKKTKMVIIDGVPGTSKTLLAIYCSLKLMDEKKVSDLIYIRSLIQARDGATGYLQGDLAEKTLYFNVPLMDKLEELLPKTQTQSLLKEERVTALPTSMLRGYNFAAKAICLDEAQNCSFDSILTAATRIAEFSKLFVIGDSVYQNDLGKGSGFKKFVNIFSAEDCKNNGIHYFKLGKEDILRSGFVKYVMEKVEEYDQAPGKVGNYTF